MKNLWCGLWLVATGCTCINELPRRYTCTQDLDCIDGQRCLQGECRRPSACAADLETDVAHCGACEASCPAPLHADAVCRRGKCGRGPCHAGFFDLDEAFGCESTCTAFECVDDRGRVVAVSTPPLPEHGPVFQTTASSGAHGAFTQTSPQYVHTGTLGQPTPLAPARLTGPTHENLGGFSAAER